MDENAGFGKYILKGKAPILCEDLIEWGKWLQNADRNVKLTQIGKLKVSTVFLGLDHQFGDGSPLLFETMVFGGKMDGEMDRYSTWEEAESGHKKMVALVKKSQKGTAK